MNLTPMLTAALLVAAAPPAAVAEWTAATGHVREIDPRPTATDTVVTLGECP